MQYGTTKRGTATQLFQYRYMLSVDWFLFSPLLSRTVVGNWCIIVNQCLVWKINSNFTSHLALSAIKFRKLQRTFSRNLSVLNRITAILLRASYVLVFFFVKLNVLDKDSKHSEIGNETDIISFMYLLELKSLWREFRLFIVLHFNGGWIDNTS